MSARSSSRHGSALGPGRGLLRGALFTALLSLSSSAAWARTVKNFVVVVANNRSLTPGVAPLRYADDDGARWYELLAPLAARISLFTVLDEESQRVFRDLVAAAEPPTVAAVLARLAAYNVEMAAARAAGFDPVLYLVVVGHGEVTGDGEGYVSLLDGPLTRGQLFREIIAPSKAAFNHVVIDACNAYLLVARRGDDRGPSAADAIRRYVADEDLDRYPTTGVLLSTSRAQATHEWSVYGGGIFSHEVRSALAGAADANGDGRIEYSEVAAFVAAANLRVDDSRARLDLYVRAPRLDRGRPLMDLAAARFQHFLRIPSDAAGRYWLEDDRGVRYADVNKAPERPVVLALVEAKSYFLRTDVAETSFRLGAPGTVDFQPGQLVARTVASRGAVEESFHRHLFEVPFGPSFYRGYVASNNEAPVADPPSRPFVAPPVAAGGIDRTTLERHGETVRMRLRNIGLRPGDDAYADLLATWSADCERAGNLREAERALVALDEKTADLVIDGAFIARKLERVRFRLAAAPAGKAAMATANAQAAAAFLAAGDTAAANRLLNAALDGLDPATRGSTPSPNR